MDIRWIQIYQMLTTLALLLWKLGESVTQENREHSVSACFSKQRKSVILNCTQGEMVKLNRIFYGASEDEDDCHYRTGQCIMDLPETEQYSCIGRPHCQINLPSGDFGKKIPTCKQFSTYAQANYQCIKAESVTDICSSTTITKQSGYISSPRYPNNYFDNQDCRIRIESAHKSQKIQLYIIDLILEWNQTDCADWLQIFDGHRAQTYCGTRVREPPIMLMDNTAELIFHSNSQKRQKGFWLYYQAVPYIEELTTTETHQSTALLNHKTSLMSKLTATNSLESATENTHKIKPSDVSTDDSKVYSTLTVSNTVYDGGTALTAGAVVGVIISMFLVITVIILVILLCCRKKKSHDTSTKMALSTSCNSEASFLHFTNECYPQNNLSNSSNRSSIYQIITK